MKARDLIRHQMVPNNIYARLRAEQLERIDRRDADLEVAELSDLGVDIGSLNSGIITRGDDITIDQSTSPATFTGSGTVECWPAIEVLAGVYAVWFCLNAGVVTFYVNSADGKIYAGSGAVVLDQDGITLDAPVTAVGSINEIKWKTDDDATLIGEIYSYYTGSGADKSAIMYLISAAKNGGSGTFGELHLIAEGPGGFNNSTRIDLNSNPGNPMLGYKDSFNNSGTLHYGDYAGYKVLAASTTPTAFYTRTIKAGSMGAYGLFVFDGEYVVSNTGGTSVFATITVSFGGTTILSYNTPATTTTNPRVITAKLHIVVSNAGAANSQAIQNSAIHATNPSTVGSGIGVPTTNSLTKAPASVDTDAADRDFVVTITLNTATNSKVEQLESRMFGPYYAAS